MPLMILMSVDCEAGMVLRMVLIVMVIVLQLEGMIVMVYVVVVQRMMNVEFVVEIIQHVQIVMEM